MAKLFKPKKVKTETPEDSHITEEEMDRARGFSRQVKKYILRRGQKEMADGSGMIKESQ